MSCDPLLVSDSQQEHSCDDISDTSCLNLESKTEHSVCSPLPLRHYLASSTIPMIFLYVMLLDWNFSGMSEGRAFFIKLWYAFAICGISYITCVLLMYTFTAMKYQYDESRLGVKVYCAAFAATIIFQMVSSVLTTIFAAQRIGRVFNLADLKSYPAAMRYGTTFTVVFMFLSLLGCILTYAFSYSTGIFIGELLAVVTMTWATCSAATVNLLFILVDTQACQDSLEHLHDLCNSHSLALEDVVAAREDIHERLSAFSWPNWVLSLSALTNTVTFLVVLFTNSPSHLGLVLLSISWYSKEVLYLFIVLVRAARMNEMADNLLRKAGSSSWGAADMELRRIQVYISLQSQPMSFTLLGTRPTRRSVAWQGVSLLVAVVISLMRSLFFQI